MANTYGYVRVSSADQNEARQIVIRERQRQGIAAARARGVRFGRPARKLPPQFAECVTRFRKGEITLKTAAALCEMPESTFRDKLKTAQHLRTPHFF